MPMSVLLRCQAASLLGEGACTRLEDASLFCDKDVHHILRAITIGHGRHFGQTRKLSLRHAGEDATHLCLGSGEGERDG